MRTTITTRHTEIAPPLRDRATLVMGRLASLGTRATEASVVFGLEAGRSTAELRLHAVGGAVLVAAADGPDHRTALDRAEGKLRRQLIRATGKPRARRHGGSPSA